jgi:hypothetical protein
MSFNTQETSSKSHVQPVSYWPLETFETIDQTEDKSCLSVRSKLTNS